MGLSVEVQGLGLGFRVGKVFKLWGGVLGGETTHNPDTFNPPIS